LFFDSPCYRPLRYVQLDLSSIDSTKSAFPLDSFIPDLINFQDYRHDVGAVC
jgi:hypothetical protein